MNLYLEKIAAALNVLRATGKVMANAAKDQSFVARVAQTNMRRANTIAKTPAQAAKMKYKMQSGATRIENQLKLDPKAKVPKVNTNQRLSFDRDRVDTHRLVRDAKQQGFNVNSPSPSGGFSEASRSGFKPNGSITGSKLVGPSATFKNSPLGAVSNPTHMGIANTALKHPEMQATLVQRNSIADKALNNIRKGRVLDTTPVRPPAAVTPKRNSYLDRITNYAKNNPFKTGAGVAGAAGIGAYAVSRNNTNNGAYYG